MPTRDKTSKTTVSADAVAVPGNELIAVSRARPLTEEVQW